MTNSSISLSSFSLKPLPSRVGSTLVLPYRKTFIRENIPEPLPPALGSTRVFFVKTFSETNTATVPPEVLSRSQYPPPAPNRIGEEDLPGGFRRTDILGGQSSPMYDLSRGVVQIDVVKVFFDARA